MKLGSRTVAEMSADASSASADFPEAAAPRRRRVAVALHQDGKRLAVSRLCLLEYFSSLSALSDLERLYVGREKRVNETGLVWDANRLAATFQAGR